VVCVCRKPYADVAVVSVRDPVFPPEDPRPDTFTYHRQRIRVARVLEHWREAGRWWEQEPESVCWRVEAVDGGVYELLMYRTVPPRWMLMAIYD
jgi:hypothetical protein